MSTNMIALAMVLGQVASFHLATVADGHFPSVSRPRGAACGAQKLVHFAEWWNKRNTTHQSPMTPVDRDGQDAPVRWEAGPPAAGKQRSDDDCYRALIKAAAGADHAVCAQEFVTNYDPKRMPAGLTEAKCLCARPIGGFGRRIVCEPQLYKVRVLKFDDGCSEFVETTEELSMACVPVYKRKSKNNIDEYDLANEEVVLETIPAQVLE